MDLSRDEKAKHFLPRWLRDAPRALAGGVAVAARPALRNAKRFCGAFRHLWLPCPYLQSPLPTPRLRKAAVLSKEAAILLILAAKFNIMPPILTGVW